MVGVIWVIRGVWENFAPYKTVQLHKKNTQIDHQLHSTSEKISSTPYFLRAPQEVLHQFWELLELLIITPPVIGYTSFPHPVTKN